MGDDKERSLIAEIETETEADLSAPKPFDPYCNRRPDQISECIAYAEVEETTPDQFVIDNEGTYNPSNGHFACTECYIKLGMPSSPVGWKAP